MTLGDILEWGFYRRDGQPRWLFRVRLPWPIELAFGLANLAFAIWLDMAGGSISWMGTAMLAVWALLGINETWYRRATREEPGI